MKTVIVTICIGEFYSKLSKITNPLLKNYANKIGSDLITIDESNYPFPHYAKCDLFDILEKYDRICYIDTDVIIRPDSPNIFDIVPYHQVGLFEEGRFTPRIDDFIKYLKLYNVTIPKNVRYYNTGVIVASKIHKSIFRKPLTFDNHFYEQTYLNMNLVVDNIDVFWLSYKFNRMCALDKFTGEHRLASYFVHYAGLNISLPEKDYFQLIQRDVQEWRQKNYYLGYNIAIIVGGGIGDQVSAEPAVRYICENLYKEDNVIIVCENPSFFTHINRPVYQSNDSIPDFNKYYKVETLQPTMEDSLIYQFISPLLIHACNLASINSIKMELPLKDRHIKLEVCEKSLSKVKEKVKQVLQQVLHPLVVFHLGTSWPSKTFPADVWQSYILILLENGITPILIGQDIKNDFRGVNKEVSGENCIDLRNDLSIDELIALISISDILISNDSCPVHIAGAFDHVKIGLIATCKHPDYILPHRGPNSSPYFNAYNIEKIPMYYDYERRPTFIDGSRVDKASENRIRECLPDPEYILKFVRE